MNAEDRDQLIVELHGQGLGRNQIATRVGCSAGTVTAVCKRKGLSFDRYVLAQATEAIRVDNAARRAKILEGLYVEAQAKLDEMRAVRQGRQAWRALVKGEGGSEHPDSLDFIPARDFQQVGQTVGFFAAHAAKLEAVDSPEAKAAASLLTSLAAGLQIDDRSEPGGRSEAEPETAGVDQAG